MTACLTGAGNINHEVVGLGYVRGEDGCILGFSGGFLGCSLLGRLMTATEIRASFFEFFQKKRHTLVPSASLLPQSPGLLFTNAGMNQFVPYFLGTEKVPYEPGRVVDTQKCIRAGGKHNDLDDVGYDTYHHTFFEMLGNWSFGDYFKREAIEWGWELIVEVWGVPAERLYATVYKPGEGDPASFDQEAYDYWAELFRGKGLDPAKHIVNGNVKDNFWMMGETGPCGPCSELHVDLTPGGDSGGRLVNQDSDLCIEIWNLVFIQFNAEADGTFRNLPAKHVDTGMGFERACSLIQNTKGFTDFSRKPTNYATDVFAPLFRRLEELSGEKYEDVYPEVGEKREGYTEELRKAIAFRVIADHLRTLCFSVADGILPGNSGRNYVLRRILRRAVRYGRELGFSGGKPFFGELVGALVGQMGEVFPELVSRQEVIRQTLVNEEESFNQTLDRGLKKFEDALGDDGRDVSGELAFELYDTFGFPIDLTQLLAEERGGKVDMGRYEKLMERQRERARGAQKSSVVRALDISSEVVTGFVGFEQDEVEAEVLEVHAQGGRQFIITDRTVFFAEMGGQVGDSGVLLAGDEEYEVEGVQQIGGARAHVVDAGVQLDVGSRVLLKLDAGRRRMIEAHHTATHLLHWALREVVSKEASQQGSAVDENRLRFDFNSGALTGEQVRLMEEMVNGAVRQDMSVSWTEVPYDEVRGREDIMQFFGDKYGETVRVVEIGRGRNQLDGYSMELCGGTHVRGTSEVGLFKIRSEGAVAAGVRRIEAVCGEAAWEFLNESVEEWSGEMKTARKKLAEANGILEEMGEEPVKVNDFPYIMTAMLTARADISEINATFSKGLTALEEVREAAIDAEKRVRKLRSAQSARLADEALAELIGKGGAIIESFEGESSLLQELQNGLRKRQFAGGGLLVVDDGDKLHLAVHCGEAAIQAGWDAGVILRELVALGGGKGGGRAEQARGAVPDRTKLQEILEAMREKVGG